MMKIKKLVVEIQAPSSWDEEQLEEAEGILDSIDWEQDIHETIANEDMDLADVLEIHVTEIRI